MLLISASASPCEGTTGAGTAKAAGASAAPPRGEPAGRGASSESHGCSPMTVSPVCARAVRSPVPTAPYSVTAGWTRSRSASTSACAIAGCSPEPPASTWLARTASIARTWRAGSRAPTPPAWLRSSRRSWPARSASLRNTIRLAPTPVSRPYIRPAAASRCAVCQERSALATAAGGTVGSASPSASRATAPASRPAPSSTTKAPSAEGAFAGCRGISGAVPIVPRRPDAEAQTRPTEESQAFATTSGSLLSLCTWASMSSSAAVSSFADSALSASTPACDSPDL